MPRANRVSIEGGIAIVVDQTLGSQFAINHRSSQGSSRKCGRLSVPIGVISPTNRQQDRLAVQVFRAVRVVPFEPFLVAQNPQLRLRLRRPPCQLVGGKVVDHGVGGLADRRMCCCVPASGRSPGLRWYAPPRTRNLSPRVLRPFASKLRRRHRRGCDRAPWWRRSLRNSTAASRRREHPRPSDAPDR